MAQQRSTAGVRRRWLSAHRPLVGAVGAVVLAGLMGLVGSVRTRPAGVAADDGAELARAERVVDSLVQRAWMDEAPNGTPGRRRPALDERGLVALGYVVRAQLGVGSPFRLAAFALRDPRLEPELGRTVAWAILARTARGAVYAADSVALAFAPPSLPAGRQLAVIDAAVDGAPDARTGEEAVRVGYALAAAEGAVGGPSSSVATRLAALARDRRLAREDAARLLRASGTDRNVDALTLLVRWRAEHRFLVEEPLLGARLRPADGAAVRGGLAVRDSLRLLARVAARTPDAMDSTAGVGHRAATLLPPVAARRLAELPSVRGGPPQAAVAVAASAYGRQLLRADPSRDSTPALTAARRRFADRVRSEETLVAELAVVGHASDGPPADVARVALAATVAMRPFGQDTLLPTAVVAPTAEALAKRFGLRAVSFDASVPASWRPYQLAQLAGALEELQSVLPAVQFDGLAVHVGESAKRDSALALHDPSSRTVYLPAASSGGTIAHELAHDLDWQTARTRLAVRGTYSTDRAMRDGKGSIAVSVRGLAAARPGAAASGSTERPAERPAELFARGVDWFVATSLAGAGRMNGALSAVQDETLAGYAGVVPPTAGDGAADALVTLLADMTVVPATARDRFLAQYGAVGETSALALVRAATGASTRGSTERLLRTFGLVSAPCVSVAASNDWRVTLVRAAAESRAIGMLRARSRWTAPNRWSWEARATLGAPWNPALADSAVARTRDAVLRAAAWEDATRHPIGGGALAHVAAAPQCR